MLKVLALFVFLLACTPQKPEKDILRVIINARPPTLDPRKATTANGQRISSLIFNGLVRPGEPGKAQPDLAFRWEFKGRELFFYLKPLLQFSNGRPVTKEDILFSFKEFQKKSSPFHSAFKNIQLVEVKEIPFKNEREKGELPPPLKGQKHFIVKILLKKFQASFVSADLPVLKILPKKEILKSPEQFKKTPWGTGEFKAIKNDFREILLERVRPAPPLSPKFISFRIIRDSLTRTGLMLSQAVDIAPSVIPLSKIYKFQREKKSFRIFQGPGLSTTYLLINLKSPLLKNRDLREALTLSIHREEIIKYKLKGYAEPARSLIPPTNYFFNQQLSPLVFDLPKARAILRRLSLEGASLQLSSSNNPETVKQARVLVSQLSQTGLKISLKAHEWGTFYKDVGGGGYELALMKWVGVLDPDIYRLSLHSENVAPQGRNRSFYKNPSLDRLLEQGLKEPDRRKRKLIYDQVQSLVAQDFALIPLWHDMEISVVRANIEGYELRRNGDFLSLPLIRKK